MEYDYFVIKLCIKITEIFNIYFNLDKINCDLI